MPTIEEFRQAYINELYGRFDTRQYFVPGEHGKVRRATSRDDAASTVDAMIANICKSGNVRIDWLRDNPAMKVAAKKVGLKNSREFREFILDQDGDWRPAAQAQAMREG